VWSQTNPWHGSYTDVRTAAAGKIPKVDLRSQLRADAEGS
jgi:hypothetical protein